MTMFELLKAMVGIGLVMGLWFALQALVRRRTACAADRDVLEYMVHGCAGCHGSGNCRNSRHEENVEKEERHEFV